MKNSSKRIVVDGRNIPSSTGRYTERLLHHLQRIDTENEYHVIVKSEQDWRPKAGNFQTHEVNVADYTFAEQLKLWWKIRRIKPDVTHFAMPQQPVLPLPGRRVTTIHDLTMLRWHNETGNTAIYRFKLFVFRRLLRWVAHTSDAIITPTKWVKLDCIKTLKADPIKITITYEAAEQIAAKSEPVKEYAGKRFLFFSGNIFAHKNVGGLIDAFKLVAATKPDLHLMLAGKTSDYGQQLKDRHRHQQIHWLGFVSDENLRWLFENAAAYVYPSFSEGFGLPGLEAMKYERPLISSNATCLPEVYGEAAEYFDPNSVEDMARAIRNVLDDDMRVKELVKLGRKQLKKYSWKRMAEQTLKIYESQI